MLIWPEDFINEIINGDVLEVLRQMPDGCVDTIITSPPYWGLRDYGEETKTVWGGDFECEHKWGDSIPPKNYKSGKHGPNSNIGANAKEAQHAVRTSSGSNFCQKCGAWHGQLGLEPTLDLYLEHLLQVTKELKRVLKPTGVMWWDHGDSYSCPPPGNKKFSGYYGSGQSKKAGFKAQRKKPRSLIKPKCLNFQNYRLILKMIDEQGWILRDTIIWAKKMWIKKINKTMGNAMPSSVRDRCNFTYEPVFMLTKKKHYYFDQEILRVPYTEPLDRWGGDKLKATGNDTWAKGTGQNIYRDRNMRPNKAGANRPNVWQVNTEPMSEAHFAVFPPSLIKGMVEASCPQWICKSCGKARVRITEKGKRKGSFNIRIRKAQAGGRDDPQAKATKSEIKTYDEDQYRKQGVEGKTLGWTDCRCGAGFKAGIVLDPFIGSGTTALVALQLGRRFVGIDISPKYAEMARKRIAPELRQGRLF